MFRRRTKTCILHIGMHKTGTTSVQQALNGYDARGTIYADIGPPNHSVPMATIFRSNPSDFWVHKMRNRSEAEVQKLRKKYLRRLEKSAARRRDRMIVSAEAFSRQFTVAEIENAVAWFKDRFDTVEAIGYVRDFDSYAASGFQEFVKHGAPNFQVPTPDFRHTFQPWINCLGPENVTIVKYGGDTVEDFFRRFGLRQSSKTKITTNTSLSGPAMALLLRYNREAGKTKGSSERVAQFHRVVDYLRSIDGPRFAFSKETLDAARIEQAEDIAWLEELTGFSVSEKRATSERPVDDLKDMLAYAEDSLDLVDKGHPVGAHLLAVFERARGGGWAGQMAPKGTLPPTIGPAGKGGPGHRQMPRGGQANPKAKAKQKRAQQVQSVEPLPVLPALSRTVQTPSTGRPSLILLDDYAVRFTVPERAREVVVSFEAADRTIPRGNLRRQGFGESFLLENGYAVVSVLTGSANWFRDREIQDFLADEQFRSFLDGFDKIHAYGSSMGGYGACAFAELLGVHNLVTFQPISTLIESLVPWEDRFNAMHRLDWTGPYADATLGVSSVESFYLLYDPDDPDAKHAARFRDAVPSEAYRPVEVPGAEHAVPRFLLKRKALKSISLMAFQGEPASDIVAAVEAYGSNARKKIRSQ